MFVNEHRISLQIVTVPNHPSLWHELHSRNKAEMFGDLADAVSVLRQAIIAKSLKASGAVLALDLTQLGAIANPKVVDEYLASFEDPVKEFSFKSVWLVGPTSRSTIKLSTDLGSV